MTHQGPKNPGLTESALNKELDHRSFRSTFQRNSFYDSIDSQSRPFIHWNSHWMEWEFKGKYMYLLQMYLISVFFSFYMVQLKDRSTYVLPLSQMPSSRIISDKHWAQSVIIICVCNYISFKEKHLLEKVCLYRNGKMTGAGSLFSFRNLKLWTEVGRHEHARRLTSPVRYHTCTCSHGHLGDQFYVCTSSVRFLHILMFVHEIWCALTWEKRKNQTFESHCPGENYVPSASKASLLFPKSQGSQAPHFLWKYRSLFSEPKRNRVVEVIV